MFSPAPRKAVAIKALRVFAPSRDQNRMRNEGNLEAARDYLLENRNNNLRKLLEGRYSWIREFVGGNDQGVEFGAGIGATKIFLPDLPITSTDVSHNAWLDQGGVDALDCKMDDNKFDFVFIDQVLHHLSQPKKFFSEASRILKPNGLLIIQDPYSSITMKLVLRIMRHEGFDETIDLRESQPLFCNSEDPWSANCSAARLIFESPSGESLYQGFELIHYSKTECLSFLNSGGVTAKTGYIPLPDFLLDAQQIMDKVLCKWLPSVFALQVRAVLRKL